MKRHLPWILISIVGLSATQLTASDLNLKGDLRLRVQHEKKDSSDSRLRHRMRFRLKGHSQVSKTTKASFGLATGSTDPRSTNQTYQNSFDTPDIRLDYAFVKHNLNDNVSLLGGKMKNPLYRPSDLLWDSDINPEGMGAQYKTSSHGMDLFGGLHYFVIDEIKTKTEDPSLLAFQIGVKKEIINSKTTMALSYYLSQNFQDNTLDNSAGTNSTGANGLEDEFSVIALSAHADLTDKFGLGLVRPFGEIVVNTGKESSNKGGLVGVKFGDKKVKARGAWQSKLSLWKRY